MHQDRMQLFCSVLIHSKTAADIAASAAAWPDTIAASSTPGNENKLLEGSSKRNDSHAVGRKPNAGHCRVSLLHFKKCSGAPV